MVGRPHTCLVIDNFPNHITSNKKISAQRKTLNIGRVKSYHIQRYCKLDYWLKNIHFVARETDVDNFVNKIF